MLMRNPYANERGVLRDEQLRDYYALRRAMVYVTEEDLETWDRLGWLAARSLHRSIIDACGGVDLLTIASEVAETALTSIGKLMGYDGFRHELIMWHNFTVQAPEDEEPEDGAED